MHSGVHTVLSLTVPAPPPPPSHPSTHKPQLGITVCHLGRLWTKSELLTALMAAQSVLLVFRLQWFTQALQNVRIAFLPVSERSAKGRTREGEEEGYSELHAVSAANCALLTRQVGRLALLRSGRPVRQPPPAPTVSAVQSRTCGATCARPST